MVKVLYFWFFACFAALPLLADVDGRDVVVTSGIEEDASYENRPLLGTIAVTHDQKDAIDPSSFRLEGESLDVEFVQDVNIETPIVISYYHFHLPSKPAGQYVLPKVTVSVGGKTYSSLQSSYEVMSAKGFFSKEALALPIDPDENPSLKQPPKSEAAVLPAPEVIFKLEASIEPAVSLYPGQKTTFIYRYFYNANISLTKEELPLFAAEGFVKFGEKQVKEYTDNNLSVTQISQVVEAIRPGIFSFGPSIIEGNVYTTNARGQMVFSSSTLKSEVPSVSVEVNPFPASRKPPSFNGAMGSDLTLKTTLESLPSLFVGDELRLQVEIAGKGVMNSVSLPNIRRQPGFDGFFQMSDLPAVGVVTDRGDAKRFLVMMRPLTEEITQIPSVEFSFFNPENETYTTLQSPPIPIKVRPIEAEEEDLTFSAAPLKKPRQSPVVYSLDLVTLEAIEALETRDVYNKWFGSWWVLAIIPLTMGGALYVFTLRHYLIRRQKNLQQTSQDIYFQCLEQLKESSSYYELLGQALKLKLVEKKEIARADVGAEQLPSSGLSGRVRTLLAEIEKHRFSPAKTLLPPALEKEVQELLDLKALPVKKSNLFAFSKWLLPVLVLIMATLVVFLISFTKVADARLVKADQLYHAGEMAKTIAEKNKAFNLALEEYWSLEKDYHPTYGTGKLYAHLGNTFFQLGEYPWAILNYERAKKLMPRETSVSLNLEAARDKLHFSTTAPSSVFSWLPISLPERLQLFFCLSLLLIALAIAFWWYRFPALKRCLWIALCLWGLVSLSLGYSRYVSPIHAVIVQASDLYREAGKQHAKVGEHPIPAGSVVEVLDTQSHGKWLEIISPEGDPGFVPIESIRLI